MDAQGPFDLTLDNDAPPDNFLHLALRALDELSERNPASSDRMKLMESFCNAFAKEDPASREKVLANMRRAGICDEEILDQVIPNAARQIGEKWVQDELSFAEVTISAARMQELSRTLGGQSSLVASTTPHSHSILLVIPSEEQHTMGAFVAAEQFRRKGLLVHMAIGQDAAELSRIVAGTKMSMVGISAASRKSLKSVKTIVDILKDRDSSLPIVLGGNVLNIVDDAQEKTGVDHATSQPAQAMNLTGLTEIRTVVADASEVV